MKINVQFWPESGKSAFAYGAVSVRGKVDAISVTKALRRAFGSKVSLHSFAEGTSLNRCGKITLVVNADDLYKKLLDQGASS